MQSSYTKNYIKIYLYQILSVLLGFVSMFVVIPFLSSDQTVYGIYSVCLSVTIFMAYADLGFLSAAQKYAAESYSRGEPKRELELIGFAHFILLGVVILISAVFLYLSFHPDLLIKGLDTDSQWEIAHELLLILAIFSPLSVVQRMLQMIFGIRLQEYNLQKINIAGSVIKILSVFWFFGRREYDIVGYYLFIQIVSVLVAGVGVWLARRNYAYDFSYLFKRFRFSQEIFLHTKSLAFSSLFATLAWILYYELDMVAIGGVIGANAVAIYAIGFTLLGFLRTILGVLFSPFASRFNHFVGQGQESEFRGFYLHVIQITFPLVVFPIVALAVMSEGIVISWVGVQYQQSVGVAVWLILCNVLGFVSYPAGIMLMANEQMRRMYLIAIVLPLVFWGGVFVTEKTLGVLAFGLFKFVAFMISGFVYVWFSINFLQISFSRFIRRVIVPYLPALLVMLILLWCVRGVCVTDKNKLNLLINGLITGGGILVALSVSYGTVPVLRQYVLGILGKSK